VKGLNLSCEREMRYFCVLALVFAVSKGEVWAGSQMLPQEIQEDHFAFRLPEGYGLFKGEEVLPWPFPDTPWGGLYKKRIKDLDTVFIAEEEGTLLCLGLKTQLYRKKFRRALPYEEFASPQSIVAYKESLTRQLANQGLTEVSVSGPVTSREDGVIQFACGFEFSEGLQAEEYYASLLGSHEVVYLILFSYPPRKSPEMASLFQQIVQSFTFKEKYQHAPHPRSWWEGRTWGERVEDILKLLALFFILYLGFSWGLQSLSKWRLPLHPKAVQVMSVFLSFFVCLAVFKWVEF
jgi:hypothetical protein